MEVILFGVFYSRELLCGSLWDKANVYGTSEGRECDTVTTGTPLHEPPLIDMMSNDAVLRGVKVDLSLFHLPTRKGRARHPLKQMHPPLHHKSRFEGE